MSWVMQAILAMLGITVGFELIIILIYKLTSRGKQEDE